MSAFNSKKIIFIGIVIALLVCCSLSQRGRSRSRSSSRSRSRSSSFGRRSSGGSLWGSQNCTTVNGTTTCIRTSGQSGWFDYLTIGVGGILVLFSYFKHVYNKGTQQKPESSKQHQGKIQQAMMNFEGRMEASPSSISDEIKNQMVNTFSSRNYKMVITLRNMSDTFNCTLMVNDIKKVNQNKFEIQMRGNDQVGPSKFSGLLVLKGDGIAIKLSKVYDNRSAADQVGDYDTLLYQGEGNPDHMSGEWAFYGFENSSQFSGRWEMCPA